MDFWFLSKRCKLWYNSKLNLTFAMYFKMITHNYVKWKTNIYYIVLCINLHAHAIIMFFLHVLRVNEWICLITMVSYIVIMESENSSEIIVTEGCTVVSSKRCLRHTDTILVHVYHYYINIFHIELFFGFYFPSPFEYLLQEFILFVKIKMRIVLTAQLAKWHKAWRTRGFNWCYKS